MDNLNKQQIVLLTLLVSFVTSIATGITTVSLLDQAPQPVAQTINRVVEKTIERVVSTPTGPTKETTVVVKEEDLTVSAIEKNSKNIVAIVAPVLDAPEFFLTDGVIINSEGFVIADSLALSAATQWTAILSDGVRAPLEFKARDEARGITLLKVVPPAGTQVTFANPSWSDDTKLRLGQSVISLATKGKNTVDIGNISLIDRPTGTDASLVVSKTIANSLPGSIVITLSGDIAGMRIGNDPQTFVVSSVIQSAASALIAKK